MAHRRVRNRSAIARRAPTRIAGQTGPPGTPLRRSHRGTRGAAAHKRHAYTRSTPEYRSSMASLAKAIRKAILK